MKITRILFTIIALICLSVSFVSCSGDSAEDDVYQSIEQATDEDDPVVENGS